MAITNEDLELRIKSTYEGHPDVQKAIDDITNLSSSGNASVSNLTRAFPTLSSAISSVGSVGSTVFSAFGSIFSDLIGTVTSFKAVFLELVATFEIFKGVEEFIKLNAEFEKMKVTIDVMTQGKGTEWFTILRQYALTAPVDIENITGAFRTLVTYGIHPTMDMMQSLIGVSSILPEQGKAIQGIARDLGKIQEKGHLEGLELRSLATWGVPAYEIAHKLMENIAVRTGQSIDKIKYTMVSATEALPVIIEAMKNKFGLAASAIGETWSGMVQRLYNYTKEFFVEIGESGLMKGFEDKLRGILKFLDNAFKSGEFKKTAKMVSDTFDIAFEGIYDMFVQFFKTDKTIEWGNVWITVLNTIIKGVTLLINTLNGMRLVLDVLKLAWAYFAEGINTVLGYIVSLIKLVIEGYKDLVDLLPKSIPGVKQVQAAFGTAFNFMSNLSKAQQENIAQTDNIIKDTSKDIITTANGMTTISNISIKTLDKLSSAYEKYKKIAAVPVEMVAPGEVQGPTNQPQKIPFTLTETELNEGYARFGTFTEKMRAGLWLFAKDVNHGVLKELKGYFKDFFNSIEHGFSSTFDQLLHGTLTLSKGLAAMWKTIKDAFIKAIADMLAKTLVDNAILLASHIFLEKAKTEATVEGEAERLTIQAESSLKSIAIAVATGIKQIIISAYQAAAEAYAAIALIPFVGPVLAFGAAATALALVLGFAGKIAGFEKGTGLGGVSSTGPAFLHEGEIVLNRKESDIFRAISGSKNEGASGDTNVNFHISIQSLDHEDMERIVRKKVIPQIRANIRDFGLGRTMVKEAMRK